MDIRLRHAGAEHAVRLVPEGSGFTATVDGETHHIAWVASERATATGGATVDEHAIELDGRIVRAVVARTRDRLLVALGGRVYTFETGEETRQAAGGAGSGTVVAPMPGKVLAVLVTQGDQVAVGQPLVVLEAMKMESTLTADVAGTVRTVATVPGATVGGGDVLVEIAPAA